MIPFVFMPSQSPPSREAEELSLKIAKLVRNEVDRDRALTEKDVGQALSLARDELVETRCAGNRVALAVGALVLLLGFGVLAYIKASGGSLEGITPVPMVATLALGLVVAAGIVFSMTRASR